MRKIASLLLCIPLAAPAAAVADTTVRGDVRLNVDLPKIVIRDRDRTPPRGYVRFETYREYDRDWDNRDRYRRTTYDLNGEYDSHYGRVYLQQEGNRVFGTFGSGPGATDGGKLKGRIRGNQLVFRWIDNSGSEGRGVFYLNRGARFSGTWGTFNSVNNAGTWELKRVGVSRVDRHPDRRYDRRNRY